MPSEPTLVIDDTSALGRRARALLEQGGVALSSELREGSRVLLVDPGRAQLARAVHAGVRHLVHVTQTAAADPAEPRPELFAIDGRAAFSVSLVRSQLYFENLWPRLALALASGVFVSAAPDVRAAYVAQEDTALAAAALLGSDLQVSATFHITGPVALSAREVCALTAELFDRRIAVEELTLDRLAPELVQRGVSGRDAAAGARADRALLHGSLAEASRDLARITGVAALSLTSALNQQRESLSRAAARLRHSAVVSFSRTGSTSCAPASAL